VKIHVTTSNITTREGCKEILEEAIKLGPVGGIFNLAGIIDDKLFEKMDEECFKKVYEPKVNSTLYLDELSRKLCPQLDHFVVFSSIACGYGNIGQTNYGFANSAMERIVEKRRLEGFPAKAIQWGPIDEVGMMKKMSDGKEIKSFFGMIPQKIQSCYDTMNNILSCNETIVSSIVVAEKHKNVTNSKEFFEKIMIAMGIPDIKSIDKDKPISSLGLDSIGGTEIQQALEREFSITLSIQELKTKTLNELEALIGLKSNNIKVQSITSLMDSMWTNIHSGMLNDKLIEEIKVVNGKPKMLLIPGMIAGLGSMWKNLDYSIYILQHMKYFYLKSFEELFSAIIDDVQELYKDDQEFILVGYSFGSLLALKICERFESMGKHGKLIFIDGSPYSMRTKVMESVPNKQPTDENIQNLIFNELAVKTYGTLSDEILRNVGTQTEWILKVEEFTKAITDHQSKEFLEKNLESLHNRLRMVINENFNFNISEKTKTLLIKPAQVSLKLKEDYGLSEYIKGDIKIETVPGDHYSVIERSEIMEIIMKS
jgi:fatty acid synthase, animal type